MLKIQQLDEPSYVLREHSYLFIIYNVDKNTTTESHSSNIWGGDNLLEETDDVLFQFEGEPKCI